MAVFDLGLKDQIENRVDMLRDAREIKPGRPSVEVRAIENSHSRATSSGFTFEADEPESAVGGTDKGPTPLTYFLAGYGFCEEAQYARNAIRMGIEIDEFSMEIEGLMDRRGGLGLAEKDACFEEITTVTRIETPASRDEIRELVEVSESCCYVHGTLSKAVDIHSEVIVNGDPLER